jgi:hypothetical protein
VTVKDFAANESSDALIQSRNGHLSLLALQAGSVVDMVGW